MTVNFLLKNNEVHRCGALTDVLSISPLQWSINRLGPVYLRRRALVLRKMDSFVYYYLTPQQLAGFDRYTVSMLKKC